MAQPHKGARRPVTSRLPLDVFILAARAARARRWNMSEFVGWCVEQQLQRLGDMPRPPKPTPPSRTEVVMADQMVSHGG